MSFFPIRSLETLPLVFGMIVSVIIIMIPRKTNFLFRPRNAVSFISTSVCAEMKFSFNAESRAQEMVCLVTYSRVFQ